MEVFFEAVAKIDNENAIGVICNANGIFNINLKTGESRYLCLIPDEKPLNERLYTTACYFNKKVFFVPSSAIGIAIYDIESNKISKIKIPVENMSQKQKRQKFNGYVLFEKYIFLVPCLYPSVVRIDCLSGELSFFNDWSKGKEYMFRKSPEVIGDKFFVPSVINNQILEFDMKKCQGQIKKMALKGNGYWSACKQNETLWLSPVGEGPIVNWNPKTNKTEELYDFPSDLEWNDFGFTKEYIISDELFMVPAKANMGLRVDTKTKKIRKINIPQLNGNDIVRFLFEIDNYVFLAIKMDSIEKGYRLDTINNSICDFRFEYNYENENNYARDCISESIAINTIIIESESMRLEDFLNGII